MAELEFLADFLNSFGYTINSSSNFKYVYSSDIVQCYPGSIPGGDRKPTVKERENYFAWLQEELSLIVPAGILLLGEVTAKHFFKRYLNLTIRKMKYIWGHKYQFEREGKSITIFAIPHTAYRWRNREEVDQIYKKTIVQIREILNKLLSKKDVYSLIALL